MPKFDDEQQTEIRDLVRLTLGLEGDQKLGDFLKTQINDTLNAYDKRVSKEQKANQEKLDEQLKALTEAIEKAGKGTPNDDLDLNDPDAQIDIKKLPAGIRALFERTQKAMEKLTTQVDAEKKAREAAQAKVEEAEGKRAEQDLRAAIRSTSLDKDAVALEFDPTMSDVMIEHLMPRVRKSEGANGYEMQVGVEEISKEPIYKPLAEGLKAFGATTIGKRFQVPVKGTGPTPPKGGTGKPGEMVSASQIITGGMTPAQIREAADGGKIQLEGAEGA